MIDEPDWERLFAGIKLRYYELGNGDPHSKKPSNFLECVKNMSVWENSWMDYPDPPHEFPERIPIAFAVCHPDCGVKEFIVEGSTQDCQYCGRYMFRNKSAWYAFGAFDRETLSENSSFCELERKYTPG